MRLVPHDNVSEKRMLAMPQFFDSAELALLEKRICSGFQLVDIGANAGIYSLFAAARGAKVLAIEAQPEMQQRLETNIGLNNFSSIHLAKCAVADREGEIEFHLSADNRGQASLTRTGGEALKVPCRPLLALMDEAGITQPDALKIDIEGAEDVVLGHFFRMAPRQRWPKLLFMERNTTSWREDIQATCRSLGYRDLAPGKMNVIMELG
jgi:FkbM family methyltransferase